MDAAELSHTTINLPHAVDSTSDTLLFLARLKPIKAIAPATRDACHEARDPKLLTARTV